MLSAREREVLRLVATGHVAEEIALQLTISAQTANSHVKNTYRKPFSRHAAPIIRTSNESGAGLHRQQAWQRLISEDPVVALCRARGRKLLRQHKVLAGGLESGQPMAVLLGNFIHGVVVSQRPGHPRFAVVGHDRGVYVVFRAAMDHPEAVSRLVGWTRPPSSRRWSAATPAVRSGGGAGSSMHSPTSPSAGDNHVHPMPSKRIRTRHKR